MKKSMEGRADKMEFTHARLMTAALAVFAATNIFGAEIPGKTQDHPVALVDGTIHTVSGAVIEHGTILFDKGKIVAVGTSVNLPPGTERITVTGKDVYPGMIDARSTIGLVEIDAIRATRDIAETGSLNPNIRAEVGFNPESEEIPVTRANGVTTAAIFPDGGIISGSAALMNLDGWTWEEMTVKPGVGMVLHWPTMTINRAWWEQRPEDEQKKARDKSFSELNEVFANARAYRSAKLAARTSGSPQPQTDLRLEAMMPVLDRTMPLLVVADDAQQIEAVVAWADHEQLKIILVGGYDAWRVAPLLTEHKIPVILNPVYETPHRRWEPYDLCYTLPNRLYQAGIKFCITGDGSASNERNLPYHAAAASAYGLPHEEAIKAVTLFPAQILGVGDRLGSLDPGKDATIIVTNGDPLVIATNVEMEFIQGKTVSLQSRHTRLYEKYHEKYRRMGLMK
jgi:imidazolonepropionase-like amidohydrolase